MAENVILAEQEIGFALNSDYGLYFTEIYPPVFALTEGETYTVLWDGVEYICQAGPLQFMGMEWQVIGNKALLGGENTGEPFGIGSSSRDGVPVSDVIATADTSDSHMVGIRLEEPGILLKDHTGETVEHEWPEKLQVDTTDGGTARYVHESLVAEPVETTVELDFSGGEMVITPDTGKVFSTVNIPVPANLSPENIPEGMDIAGIIGTLAAGGGGGGLADYNVFVKAWKAPSPDGNIHTIVSEEELAAAGFTLYPYSEATSTHLWTAVLLARLKPGAGYTKNLQLAYRQNAEMPSLNSSYTTNTFYIYYDLNSKLTFATTNVSKTSTSLYNIGGVGTYYPGLRPGGLAISVGSNSTAFPQGEYIAVVVQHKTKTTAQLIAELA